MATPGTGWIGSGSMTRAHAAPAQEDKSVEVNIRSFAAAFLAAQTADAQFDLASAITFYRKALEFDPTNERIRERLMVDLFMDGRFDEGIEIVRSLEADGAVDQLRDLALAVDAMRRGDYDKAVDHLDTASTNPIDRLLNTLIAAWADAGAGDGAKALASLESLEGPPWYPVFTQFHAAAIAEFMGDIAKARQIYQTAVTDKSTGSAAPDTFVRTVMALAALEARQGNMRAALDTLALGEEFSPGFAPITAMRQSIKNNDLPDLDVTDARQGAAAALFSLGSAVNRKGAEETVTLYLQLARALDPENAATLVTLGNLKETLGKREEAIAIYRQVPKDSPMRRISELQLGLALSDLGNHEEARAHLKALIEADPSDLRSYLAYGSVLSSDEDYEAMAETYEKAIAIVGAVPSRNDWNLFFQLGIAYERLKQWPRAEAALQRALQLYPNQPQVMNYLGYSWIDMNINLEAGMEMIQAAVDLRPNDGYIVDSLGWAYYRLGAYEEAVQELERAVELRPADPTINDHLGDAYWRVGRKIEAGFQWNRALIHEPTPELEAEIKAKLKDGLPPVEPSPSVPSANGEPKTTPRAPEPRAPATGSDDLPEKTEWRPLRGNAAHFG
ncbi:tetratricopeptide repeat protein [Pseudohoeflea sp. DP4N28-3]|uniref:Tetratricopeptide repeat protein n=2 Tax=Pseudohoeflea coraliihabitans TaxID=2860393 RepID=A0ABS6WPH2_9HYPH|nr:tetratricopeptide repeat protein [Pseudohoeflea sp. DP4N28-3]